MLRVYRTTKGHSVTDGPTIAGEPTELVAIDNPNFGDNIEESNRDIKAAGLTNEIWRDAESTSTITRGKQSGRVYEVRNRIKGPNIQQEQVTTYHYGTPVSIDLPSSRFSP
jgi:hypothetical protein